MERLLSAALQGCCRHFSLGRVLKTLRTGSAAVSAHSLQRSSTTTFSRGGASGLFSGGFIRSVRRSFCTSAQPTRDVTLFQHDRTRFFRLLSVFCGGQFVFWTYLAHFAYTGLRDTSGSTDKGKNKASTTVGLAGMWSFEMNLGSNTWRYGFTLGCVALGAGIVGLGALFCRRSVSKVILHRGGKMVTVFTQSPLGPEQGRRLTMPLSQVACYAHRQESPSFIPLRVKGHKFYFLLDKEGTVNNARLFDVTVGAYRRF